MLECCFSPAARPNPPPSKRVGGITQVFGKCEKVTSGLRITLYDCALQADKVKYVYSTIINLCCVGFIAYGIGSGYAALPGAQSGSDCVTA